MTAMRFYNDTDHRQCAAVDDHGLDCAAPEGHEPPHANVNGEWADEEDRAPVTGYKLTDLGVYPDERCDATAVVPSPHGTEYHEISCALHHEHDPHEEPHTDGDGAYWGDDGEVEYQ